MNEEKNNRIELTKDLKARLLNTIVKGYLDLDEFPEIKEKAKQSNGFTGFHFLPYTPEADEK